MSELKPCPFHNCLTCACVDEVDMSVKDWNTRPIEDELRKRIAVLEATLSANNELLIPALKKRESEIVELSSKTISKLNKRIAELEGFINQLIEAGESEDSPMPAVWLELVYDWKEREE